MSEYQHWEPNRDLIKADKNDIFCEEFDHITYHFAYTDPAKALSLAFAADEFEQTAQLGYALDWQNVITQIERCIGQCRSML